jgi:hypothetical protein
MRLASCVAKIASMGLGWSAVYHRTRQQIAEDINEGLFDWEHSVHILRDGCYAKPFAQGRTRGAWADVSKKALAICDKIQTEMGGGIAVSSADALKADLAARSAEVLEFSTKNSEITKENCEGLVEKSEGYLDQVVDIVKRWEMALKSVSAISPQGPPGIGGSAQSATAAVDAAGDLLANRANPEAPADDSPPNALADDPTPNALATSAPQSSGVARSAEDPLANQAKPRPEAPATSGPVSAARVGATDSGQPAGSAAAEAPEQAAARATAPTPEQKQDTNFAARTPGNGDGGAAVTSGATSAASGNENGTYGYWILTSSVIAVTVIAVSVLLFCVFCAAAGDQDGEEIEA